eukprot:6787493-Prymnesium_polylepis.2
MRSDRRGANCGVMMLIMGLRRDEEEYTEQCGARKREHSIGCVGTSSIVRSCRNPEGPPCTAVQL